MSYIRISNHTKGHIVDIRGVKIHTHTHTHTHTHLCPAAAGNRVVKIAEDPHSFLYGGVLASFLYCGQPLYLVRFELCKIKCV